MSTALEEATARCASLMDSSSVHVTLPTGLNVPASPESRARARKLWAEENGSPQVFNALWQGAGFAIWRPALGTQSCRFVWRNGVLLWR